MDKRVGLLNLNPNSVLLPDFFDNHALSKTNTIYIYLHKCMWHQGTIKAKVVFVIVLPNLRPHVLDTRVKSRAGVGSSGHL